MSDDAAQTSSEPTNKFTPTVTMVTLLGVTVIYVVGLGLLSTHLSPCEGATTDAAWTTRYLGCRTINEFGDALAGAFAPLAFLWLAGAVFIQSRELAAQRKELGLARDEARQTRAVLAQQAAESRAATAFIGEQTVILKAQQTQKEQEEADEEFDQMLNAFRSRYFDASLKLLIEMKDGNQGETFFQLCAEKKFSADDFLHSMYVRTSLNVVKDFYHRGLVLSGWRNREYFMEMINKFEEIIVFTKRLTPAHQQRAKALRLEEIYAQLQRIATDLAPYAPNPTA